jgi:hypothetical protein
LKNATVQQGAHPVTKKINRHAHRYHSGKFHKGTATAIHHQPIQMLSGTIKSVNLHYAFIVCGGGGFR